MTTGGVAEAAITADRAAGVAITGADTPATTVAGAGRAAEMMAAMVRAVEETIRAVPAQTTADGAAAGRTMARGQTLGRENRHGISTRPGHAPAEWMISSKSDGPVDVGRTMQMPKMIMGAAWIAISASNLEMIAGSMADKGTMLSTTVGCLRSHGHQRLGEWRRPVHPKADLSPRNRVRSDAVLHQRWFGVKCFFNLCP
jgi:hypothetical protein